jgi:hypothetical protein
MRLTLCLFALLSFKSLSQYNPGPEELTLYGGPSFYTFIFKAQNSPNDIEYKYRKGFTYGVSLPILLGKKIVVRPDLFFYQAGATAIYGGNYVSWNLNYVGGGASYLFKMIDQKNMLKYEMSAGLSTSVDYLISAQQNNNKLNYDLKETDAFKTINVHGGPLLNLKYLATQSISLSLEYKMDLSFNQIEGNDTQNGQRTRNLGHLATLGIGLRIR